MRLSVDKDDPGFSEDAINNGAVITLDGKFISYCITADEEQGFVTCFALDENGHPFIDPDIPGQAKRYKRYGVVRIFQKMGAA